MAKTIFEEMGGTYTQVGDYFLPNLKLPEEETQANIGVWGMRHKRFLKENHRVLYASLMTSGKLVTYLDDIEQQATDMFLRLVKELAEKERERQILIAKQTADKAVATTENIKEAVKPVFDNWRSEINSKFNRIQKGAGAEFKMLRTEMYTELERRAGCDLNTRLRNKRKRMAENGCTKTEINSLNKMDVIDDDKKLREIFSKIVTEYEIKYCA